MIIELAVVAAAAALSGAFARRALKRRSAPPPEDEPLGEPQEPPSNPLSVGIGDVIQVGDATRWPRAGLMLTCDGEVFCAVLLSEDSGTQEATVMMAPPDEHLYWLVEQTLALPPSPPARLQIDGCLLDRAKLMAVGIEPIGEGAPDLGPSGRLALYLGTVGDAAVVLEAGTSRVWYGQKLGPDEYDRLGQVVHDP